MPSGTDSKGDFPQAWTGMEIPTEIPPSLWRIGWRFHRTLHGDSPPSSDLHSGIWTPTAAARSEDLNSITRRELNSHLVGQGPSVDLRTMRPQPVFTWRARFTTSQAPRPRHPSLCDQRQRRRLEDLNHFLDAVPARRQARSTAPPPDAVTKHLHRIRPLERLHGRITRVGHIRVDSGLAG